MNRTLALIRALAFLQSRSLVNALKVRVRRLRQPKYLIGAVVGLGYMYLWVGRAVFSSWRHGAGRVDMPGEAMELFEALAALVVFVLFLGSWLFSGERASLRLSEAELNFLLPAPLTRKMLVRFRLIRALVGTFLSALFLTLFTGRMARDGHAIVHMLSWWLVLTVMNLHAIGASFTVQRLTEAGLASWLRRVLTVGLGLCVAATIVLWLRGLPAPQIGLDGTPATVARDFNDWVTLALNSGPGPWLLAPFRWLVRPWFAADAWEFLKSLPPVLALIGLHYWWIERSDVAFEEASLDAAQKRAALRSAAKEGKLREASPTRALVPLFRLGESGFAPVALVWKHLIRSRFTRGKLVCWIGLVLLVAVAVHLPFVPRPAAVALASVCSIALLPLLFIGGASASLPFRRDLNELDVLKGYPLPGWQIVLGQLLGGAAVIGTLQSLAILGAALTYPAVEDLAELSPMLVGIVAGSLWVVIWPLNLVNAFMPSAAALLFPAWMKTSSGRDAHAGGIEVVGQRLLMGLLQLLATVVAWVPAGLLGAGGFFGGNWLQGPELGVALAALLGTAVLVAEAAAGVWLLGRLLDRYDASAEQ